MVLTLFMLAYRVLWTLLLPVVILYLWKRGRRDADYWADLRERFGVYRVPLPRDAIWVHAVSLGEIRSATALIQMLVARGDRVVITNFTPAGRREAKRQFATDIAAGRVAVVWVPFDMAWTYARFFRACTPRIGLTLEVEVWPMMIHAARRAGVPLFMCNGQYGTRPLTRDSRGLRIRQRVMRGLSGVFVKSQMQAARFETVGVGPITITGELRFDQPIPQALVDAAQAARSMFAHSGEVIAIASGVEGEEELFVSLITRVRAAAIAAGRDAPLFVYVPRAPERFDAVAEKIAAAGLNLQRRSLAFTPDLAVTQNLLPAETAVILGDSLGEMFFYLGLSDRVIVGGGFTPAGAHNIIEPLSLRRPVVTGPHTWPIEYPFVEAEAAGVALSVPDCDAMAAYLAEPLGDMSAKIDAFLQEHAGASAQTVQAIDKVISRAKP